MMRLCAPCRRATCRRSTNTVCPMLPWKLSTENPDKLARLDVAVEELLSGYHGSSLLRIGPDMSLGALQRSCSDCGLVFGPEIAHSLHAFSRWRWIIVHMVCARHGWRWSTRVAERISPGGDSDGSTAMPGSGRMPIAESRDNPETVHPSRSEGSTMAGTGSLPGPSEGDGS